MPRSKSTDDRLRSLQEEVAALRRERDEARQDLKAILDHLPAMVGYWDRNLCNRFCNDAYRDWFGLSPEEIEGKHIRDVLGEELYRLNLPYINAALSGIPQMFERTIPNRNSQSERRALAHYIPDEKSDGIHGFYVLVSDISEIHEARAALCASETRYKAIIEDQTDAISRFLPDGRFTFVNDVYCQLFGKQREELIGTAWKPVCHPEDLARVEAELAKLSDATPVVLIENRVLSQSRGYIWMQFINRALFCAGRMIEIQSVGRDITCLKESEQAQREQSEKLEILVGKRTEALRRLAVQAALAEERERRNIARELHDDLGQLLYVARLRLHTLQRSGNNDDLPSLVREIDETLSNATQRARSLTAQLSPPILDALGLVPALAWLADKMLATYGVTVIFHDDGKDKQLSSEQAIILFRAVRELLINVVKHAGCLQARVNSRLDQSGRLVLEVADRGKGMNIDTTITDCCGFGLTSLRDRISYLKGELLIDSKPGAGTRIRIQLPLRKCPERTLPRPDGSR